MNTKLSVLTVLLIASFSSASGARASENHDLLKSIRSGVYKLTQTVSGYCPDKVWPQMDASGENFTLTDVTEMNHTRVVFNNREVIDGEVSEDCMGIEVADICVSEKNHSESFTDDNRIYNKTYQTGIDFFDNTSYEAYVEFGDYGKITWYDQAVEGSLVDPASKLEDPNECVFQFVSDH